jgi:hypothetical protein
MTSTAKLFEQALQAVEPRARSKSSRIAELLPSIEEAQRRGFSQAHVARALATVGIEVTVPVLASYLHRLRRRQARTATTTPPASTTTLFAAPQAASSPSAAGFAAAKP